MQCLCLAGWHKIHDRRKGDLTNVASVLVREQVGSVTRDDHDALRRLRCHLLVAVPEGEWNHLAQSVEVAHGRIAVQGAGCRVQGTVPVLVIVSAHGL